MWNEAEKFLLKDKHIGLLVKHHGPCKIKKWDREFYFEDLLSSIVSQQLSGKAAETIFGRLKKLLVNDSEKINPESILKISDQRLRDCGVSWSKAAYMKDLASKVTNGVIDLETIDTLEDELVIQKLIKVKGIGRWTAEMFLMFTLARPDIFPLDDLGIRKGMKKIFNKDLSKNEMLELSNTWKPYRTPASWYVWRALE